ncbi:hypothetical protein D3C80_1073360 [compost metagenome]
MSWFLREGLGQGAAGNKAAAYLLIGSPTPNEPPAKSGARVGAAKSSNKVQSVASKPVPKSSAASTPDRQSDFSAARKGQFEMMPLNVNVQIHISADAGSEQIESIFSAMRRYLYDAPDN